MEGENPIVFVFLYKDNVNQNEISVHTVKIKVEQTWTFKENQLQQSFEFSQQSF